MSRNLIPELPPSMMLPSTRVRLPCRSTIEPRLLRSVLNRTMLSDDFTEIASESPSASWNRLYSMTANADSSCLKLNPRRMDSPPLVVPQRAGP
jgi:hypothetical protein